MQEHEHDVTQKLHALSKSSPRVDAAFKQRLTRTLQQQLQEEIRPPLLNVRGLLHWRWLTVGLATVLLTWGLVLDIFGARAVLTIHQGIAEVKGSPGALLPWDKPRTGQIESNGGVSIAEGSTIILPEDGAGELALFHGSRVELAPGTRITLTAVQPGSLIRDSVVRMDVSSGEVRAEVTPLRSPAERFEVATPSVLVSVKGTVFCTRVITAGHSYIATDVGIVLVTLDDPGQAYPSIEVPAGYAVDAIVGMPLVLYPQQPDSQTQGIYLPSLVDNGPLTQLATPGAGEVSPGGEDLSTLPKLTGENPLVFPGAENSISSTQDIATPMLLPVSPTLLLTATPSLSDSYSHPLGAITPTPTLSPSSPISDADLEIVQWLNPDPTAAEGRLTYVVEVTNHGPAIARGVVITDIVPSEVWLITATLPLKQRNTSLIWTLETLRVNETRKLVVEVGVRAWVTRTFTNVVSVTGTLPDFTLSNNSHAIHPRLTTAADVALTELSAPSQVGAGGVLTGMIRYTNLGPATARNVTVALQLPAALHFGGSVFDPDVSFTPPRQAPGTLWVVPDDLPIWTIDRLPVGRSSTLIFTATAQADVLGSVISTAFISATTSDGNTRNDVYQKLTSIAPMADLRISQQSSPEAVIVGDVLTYTLSYVNQSIWPAQNLWISTTLSPDVTFGGMVSAPSDLSAPNLFGRLLTWYAPTLSSGMMGQVVFTVTTHHQAQNPLHYRARIDSSTLDEPAYNVSDGYTPVLIPALQVQTTITPTRVAPQMPMTYTLQITNTGQVTFAAQSLQVAISLPPSMTYVAGSEMLHVTASGDLTGCNSALLLPGDTLTLDAVISPTHPMTTGVFQVATFVTATTPGGPLKAAHSVLFQIAHPAVTVEQHRVYAKSGLSSADQITLTVYMTNTGPSALVRLPLQDHFDPDDLYLVNAYPLPTTTAEGRPVWSDLTGPAPYGWGRDLAPRDSVSVTLVFTTLHSLEELPAPLNHRLSVSGVTDVYQNHAPDAEHTWIVAGKVRIYLALLLRQ